MAIQKLKGGEERFVLAIRAGMDETVAKRQIAAFHMERVGDAKKRNRSIMSGLGDIREITTVDGKLGAPLESVKVDGGSIVTTFPFAVGEILAYIDYLLVTRSPIKTGAYQRSHRLFADGQQVFDPLNPPLDAEVYMFISNLPYARKIEGSDTRTPQGSAPSEGVYRGATKLANGRFSKFAYIKYTMQAIIESGLQDYSSVALGGRKGGKKATSAQRDALKKHNESRYPTIRVRLRT